jgi:5-methylcytosine-specific restriction endonuclease McrBC GTP-binding regulatory subunit McrB
MPFFIPANVYVLGLMNTADRSLAVVDYALRRRFGFVNLGPEFSSSRFKEHLAEKGRVGSASTEDHH